MLGYLSIVFVGVILALIGGGGAILTVPILVYLFGLQADIATSYSLMIVGVAAAISAIQYARLGLVDYKTGLVFAIPSFVGVLLVRLFLMPVLPDVIYQGHGVAISKNQLIMLVFAIVMLFLSVSMVRNKAAKSEGHLRASSSARYALIGLEGLVIGAVTGFVGAGGGFMIVPALVILTGLPMRLAVGTSLMIIAIKSLFGFTGDIATIAIDWSFLLVITAVSVVGIFIGHYFSKKVQAKTLKVGFGYFTLVMAVVIIVQQLLA